MAAAPGELPGADLVRDGLADLRAGRESENALLVEIAAPRLRALGLEIPQARHNRSVGSDSPEHRLYGYLARHSDAGVHSQYNALLARIASYARAAEHAAAS
ncbi:MAG TPA: hypothetical protein VH061_14245 [Solirubrobacteraceae bacterium]|jgi:hypothetical protein|nr:hypothetical protein [Solirubrobacteraceae bacterium]